MADLTKLATDLQVLKNEVEQVASVNNKLDNAIDKLTDISGSIQSMLAVHEEKQASLSSKIKYILKNIITHNVSWIFTANTCGC